MTVMMYLPSLVNSRVLPGGGPSLPGLVTSQVPTILSALVASTFGLPVVVVVPSFLSLPQAVRERTTSAIPSHRRGLIRSLLLFAGGDRPHIALYYHHGSSQD